jgi:6-pyruvoyltetrahydropterin/6-carboxytetrahydropterin synthase
VTFYITKQFGFEASHQLEGLPDGHKCARLHGHSYRVVVELCSDSVDERGFVLDYGELDPVKQLIDTELDHHHLPDVVPFNTSAENLARWLYTRIDPLIPYLCAVRVSETDKTWAEWRP